MLWPNGTKTRPNVTSKYGPRAPISTPGGTTSAFHTGFDSTGYSAVKAVLTGTVIYAAYNASNGNEVRVQSPDGAIERYYHLSVFAAGVSVGARVVEGQTVGTMGKTGMATGVHLHFRVDWPMGTHHDPEAWIVAALNAVKPNQRTTKGETRRRTTPQIRDDNYNGDANYPAGTLVTPDGYITDGEAVAGSKIWFVIGKLYSHSSTFSDAGTHDLNDLTVYPNQRVVRADIANSRVREDASTASKQLSELAPGTRIVVTHYKVGEKVTSVGVTSEIWYQTAGGFVSAATCTSQSVAGLTKIEPPKPPDPIDYSRTVRPDNGANIRLWPEQAASLLGAYDRNTKITVGAYTRGDKVKSDATGVETEVWYIVDHPQGVGGKAYVWAGGFTSQSIEGLTYTEVTIPDQQYPTTKFSFTTDFPDLVTMVVPSDWSNFENEYSAPKDVDGKPILKGFPLQPAKAVPHQWGNPGITLQSVLNTFQARHLNSDDKVSPHFTVGLDSAGNVQIIQNLPLNVRAYHAGSAGNDFIGIEIDPRMTPEIIAALKKLLTALQGWALGWLKGQPFPYAYHDTLMATACGGYIRPHEAAFTPAAVDPDPDPDPDPEVMPAWFRAWLAEPHDTTTTFKE